MKNKKEKGFTLIELLIVIAIIGILSGVVLASLNIARGKGANAAVKSNLNGIRSQADIVYDNNFQNYSTVCDDPNIDNAINTAMIDGADVSGTILTRCNDSDTAWAANVLLKIPDADDSTYWCVDNTGVAKGETAELAGATVCP